MLDVFCLGVGAVSSDIEKSTPAVNYYVYLVFFLLVACVWIVVAIKRDGRKRDLIALFRDQSMPAWFVAMQRQSWAELDRAGESPFGYLRISDSVIFQKLGSLPDRSDADPDEQYRIYEIKRRWRSDTQTVLKVELKQVLPRFAVKPLGRQMRQVIGDKARIAELTGELLEKCEVHSPGDKAFGLVFTKDFQDHLVGGPRVTIICTGETISCYAYGVRMGADELKTTLLFLVDALHILTRA